MSTTIDMLAMRVETLEKQLALILKDQGDVAKSEPKKSKKEAKEAKEAKEPKKEAKKTKKSTEESSDDEEEKPKKKRGTNGYILFSNANRDDVKAQLQVGDEKPKNTEIMKQLAQMWQTISADEKAVWTAKAKEANVDDA